MIKWIALSVLFFSHQLLASTADLGNISFVTCDRDISARLTSWAQQMLSIGSSAVCDSGRFENGSCKIAGVPVDNSCQSHLETIAGALRNIRGTNGLGCLNSVNAPLAASLESAMNRGSFRVCCNQCDTDRTGDSSVTGSCARTGENFISLNITSLSGSDVESHCSGRYSGRGLEATLFHELLHTAGVSGFREHPGSMFDHPITKVPMDERDVVSDPIYGCQNFCYGSANFKNSNSCLTCGLAEPVVAARASETATWDYLNQRLLNAWELMENESTAIPRACSVLWYRSDYETGKTIAKATLLMNEIFTSQQEIISCVSRFKSEFRKTNLMVPFLNSCKEAFKTLHDRCNKFVRVMKAGETRCQELPMIHTTQVLEMCDSGRKGIQSSMIGSMIRFATDRSSVNCNEWYPTEQSCAGAMVIPSGKSKCSN